MWYVARYKPTALFSLRPANATTSGGKTLITPTPFALKMALLDAAIRVYGRSQGKRWFPRIRDLKIAIRLPDHLIVINTFIKILRPHKSGPKDTLGTGLIGPMGNTIAYREQVHYGDDILIAIQENDVQSGESLPLTELLMQIHYLGKRGSFMQFQSIEKHKQLVDDFTLLNPKKTSTFFMHGLLQILDDCGPRMTFAHANIFSGKRLSVGSATGRLLNSVVLPYRPIKTSRSFTLYERQ